MSYDKEQPFDSIESAQEFMALLRSSVEDAAAELSEEREEALSNGNPRRAEALDIALYKLKLLDGHVQKSGRLLNDLRTIRRLLYKERAAAAL